MRKRKKGHMKITKVTGALGYFIARIQRKDFNQAKYNLRWKPKIPSPFWRNQTSPGIVRMICYWKVVLGHIRRKRLATPDLSPQNPGVGSDLTHSSPLKVLNSR